MPKAAIAADIHQALDVALDLTAQVALDPELQRVDRVAKLLLVVLGEVFDARVGIDRP